MTTFFFLFILPFGFYLASGNSFIFRFYQFHLTWWSNLNFHFIRHRLEFCFLKIFVQSWHIKLIPIKLWLWPTIDLNHIICKMDSTTKVSTALWQSGFAIEFSHHMIKMSNTHTKRHKSHDNNWLSFVIHVVATFFFLLFECKPWQLCLSLRQDLRYFFFFQLNFISKCLCSSYQSYNRKAVDVKYLRVDLKIR